MCTGREYYLLICKRYLDKLFNHYTEVYENNKNIAIIQRICEKIGIYYIISLLNVSRKITKISSRYKHIFQKLT